MFGSKQRKLEKQNELQRQKLKDASRRTELIAAIREVLSSPTHVLLRADNIKISGSGGSCTIAMDEEYGLKDVIFNWTKVKEAFGSQDISTISVKASCPSGPTQFRNALSPGWRSYASTSVTVKYSFNSTRELERWIDGDGRYTRNRRYSFRLKGGVSLRK